MNRLLSHINLRQVAIASLAGAGLTAIALTATPLGAQTFNPNRYNGVQMPMGNGWQGYPGGYPMGMGRDDPGDYPIGPGNGPYLNCPYYNQGRFDPSTLETLEGTILSVERSRGQSLFITLKTDQGNQWINLGPDWYLTSQGFTPTTNSTVQVTAARSPAGNNPTLIATQIQQGNLTVQLRDASGNPVWMDLTP